MPLRPLLQYKFIIAIALLLLTTRIGLGTQFSSASDITTVNVSNAVNQERSQRNIGTLTYNLKLAAAADEKSRDMIARKYFAHVDPDGHYIWDRIVANGYSPYTMLGENLAIDFSDTAGLVAAWINSPTHRANLLNENFQDQGMGVAYGDTNSGEYSVAVTNTFGAQPASIARTSSPATAETSKTIKPKPAPVTNPAPKLPQPVAVAPITSSAVTHNPLQIEKDNLKISTDISNDLLNINVSAKISGQPTLVTAAVLGKSISLNYDGANYTGSISLEKYTNLNNSLLTVSAQDQNGQTSNVSVPLKNYQLPAQQNPKDLGNLASKAASPDLYNVFKYIVIVFGGLFILFMLGEAFHVTRKNRDSDFTRGSNIIMLLLLLSTLLLVNWWH